MPMLYAPSAVEGSPLHRRLLFRPTFALLALAVVIAVFQSTSLSANEPAAEVAEAKLQFGFDRATWRDVIQWLAEESDLALRVGNLPQGTFTYQDPQAYDLASAIDRLNLFLIPEGFALVRSQNLLTVIQLNDESSRHQLEVLAENVSVDDLNAFEAQRIVRCLIPLGDVSPAQALPELGLLSLLTPAKSLPSSKQVLVLGTVGTVRNAVQVVDKLEKELLDTREVVQAIALQHLDYEEFLTIARPHLGIPEGASGNQRMNLSSDSSGTRIFATGEKQAIELLREFVQSVDVAAHQAVESTSDHVLLSHRVAGENLNTVYDVLVTLLADRPVRLSKEESTQSIIALAPPSVHQTIENTITELQGAETEFSVYQLQTLDPYFAIGLLDEMFELNTPGSNLKIDADARSRKLFLRGNRDKIQEIEAAITQLDGGSGDELKRLVPLSELQAKQVLDLAASSWSGRVAIHSGTSPSTIEADITEQVVGSEPVPPIRPDASLPPRPTSSGVVQASGETSNIDQSDRLGSSNIDTVGFLASTKEKTQIHATVTDEGVSLQANDPAALDDFEALVRDIAETSASRSVRTSVYYLKYSTANDAVRLLADLLDAASTIADSNMVSELVNRSITAPSALGFGSFLRKSEGSSVVSAGTLTVIADERLNRILCLGTDSDLRLVDQYLKVIDRDQSLTDVEVHGKSYVIELQNTEAEEIVDVVREAYGDRVAMSTRERRWLQREQSRDGNRGRDINVQTSESDQPQMMLAVHESSNALIVTAPDALYQEVESLVKKLDAEGGETVEVLWYPDVTALESLRNAFSAERAGRRRGDR